MNSKIFNFIGLIFLSLFFLSSDLTAQMRERTSKRKVTTGRTTPTGAANLKGEYMSTTPCVNMTVRKGCVTYVVIPVEGEVMAKNPTEAVNQAQQKRMQICYSEGITPVNICPQGVTKFKVAYEKADKAAEVDFVSSK